jgi:hypothetical protein
MRGNPFFFERHLSQGQWANIPAELARWYDYNYDKSSQRRRQQLLSAVVAIIKRIMEEKLTARPRELPFRIDRIRWVKLTAERFTVPESFDIRKYGRAEMYFPTGAEVSVEVRALPEFASRLWSLRPEESANVFGGRPAIRRVRSEPDGSLTMSLAVSWPEWVVSWALQQGESVEILAPSDVRERVRKACDDLLRIYE